MQGVKAATEEERRAADRERKRAYIKRHPERRKRTLKAAFERLRADPDRYARFLAQGRESYARHPETGYLYALNWRGENRERVRANNRGAAERRRERVGAQRQEIADFAPVLRRDPCAYCGEPAGVVDHIEALATAGRHEPENLTGACRRCNARKRTTPLLHFMLKRLA